MSVPADWEGGQEEVSPSPKYSSWAKTDVTQLTLRVV